jgi:hypothetical protein
MTPDKYLVELEQKIKQHLSGAEIRITSEPNKDQLGFSYKAAVLLRNGGELFMSAHMRYRRDRPCRPIGTGLFLRRFSYMLIEEDATSVRFDYDPNRHQEISTAPFHKHVNRGEAISLDTGDPRNLDQFLKWVSHRISQCR